MMKGDELSKFEQNQINQAKRIMKPFLLRRLKSDVLRSLPLKTDEIVCNRVYFFLFTSQFNSILISVIFIFRSKWFQQKANGKITIIWFKAIQAMLAL